MTCDTYGPCSSHADCGDSAFCNPTGKCEQNFAGGPCSSKTNCPGEQCMKGYCGCIVLDTKKASLRCSYAVVAGAVDAGSIGELGAYASTWVAYAGSQLVPRDATHQNGFDYDKTTGLATFYGPPCERLSGEVALRVTVVGAGCPNGP